RQADVSPLSSELKLRSSYESVRDRISAYIQRLQVSELLSPAPIAQRASLQTRVSVGGGAMLLALMSALLLQRFGPLIALLPLYAGVLFCAWYGGPALGMGATFVSSFAAGGILHDQPARMDLAFLQTGLLVMLG